MMSGPDVWLLAALVAAVALAGWLGWRLRREPAQELERARADLSRRLTELFSLQELAYVLADSVELDRIAEQVAQYAARFIRCDGALVAMADESAAGVRVVAARGTLASLAGREVSAARGGLVGAAMEQGHLQVAEADEEEQPQLLDDVRVRRALVAPLRAHGVSVGAVAVSAETPGAFDDGDLRLVSTVATHAALALANAKFFDLVLAGKQQWETTFDALNDGIAVVDAEGCIRRANRALGELLRTPLPDLVGSRLAPALFGHPDELTELLDAVRSGRGQPSLTRRSERLDRMLRIGASRLGGRGDGWVVALIEDVTEQKALESQLLQSEKLAAVGQLVSGVAHELNNPLTSIGGLSEFLMEQPSTSARDREHLRVIHEQAERAARIVRNLLTFARKGPTDVGDIDLNDIAQRATSLITYELRLRKIELDLRLSKGLPRVYGDRFQMQQAVLNLLTNAIQAVSRNPPDRPRVVRVTTAPRDGLVMLRVADTGPGVPDDIASHIFDPFFTTKAPGEGTGLGLSITYGIVEGHRGRIEVQRGAEGGAMFTVTLPASDRTPDAGPTPEAAELAGATPLPSRCVLLVDEDPAVRQMIGVLFSHDGHRVDAARDASHGAALLAAGAYDLVIADPRAAVSAGETFADVLARHDPNFARRTIFLTADVRPETEEWLRQLGVRYFRKPFNVRDLKTAAAVMLATASSRTL